MQCYRRKLIVWFLWISVMVIGIISFSKLFADVNVNLPTAKQVSRLSEIRFIDDKPGVTRSARPREHGQPRRASPEQVRILCWIMTDPDDLDKRTVHVRDTWARDCDISLFMSSKENNTFPTIGLNVTAGRSHIASKSRSAWTYVYLHHFYDAEYFVKADPDTYMLIDNLRAYLSNCDPRESEIFGHRFNTHAVGTRYVSGGPGVVLSREALRRLVTVALVLHPSCFKDGTSEDAKTAICLSKVGARLRDTRDSEGRETFMVFSPNTHLTKTFPSWYYKYDLNGPIKGPECCSRAPISFHYVAKDMRLLHYVFNVIQHSDRKMNYSLTFQTEPQTISKDSKDTKQVSSVKKDTTNNNKSTNHTDTAKKTESQAVKVTQDSKKKTKR